MERSLQVEEEVEARREREVLERMNAEAAAGRQAVIGLEPVLAALNDKRIDTLVVPLGLAVEGVRCTQCGWLGTSGTVCMACGGVTEHVGDVVESAVAKAIQQSSRVETLTNLDGPEKVEVGALLRY